MHVAVPEAQCQPAPMIHLRECVSIAERLGCCIYAAPMTAAAVPSRIPMLDASYPLRIERCVARA
jgi:hypothetical protein